MVAIATDCAYQVIVQANQDEAFKFSSWNHSSLPLESPVSRKKTFIGDVSDIHVKVYQGSLLGS